MYGTAPIFPTPQPSQHIPTADRVLLCAVALPTMKLHGLLLKLWKCSALKASCSEEFPAHREELHPSAS